MSPSHVALALTVRVSDGHSDGSDGREGSSDGLARARTGMVSILHRGAKLDTARMTARDKLSISAMGETCGDLGRGKCVAHRGRAHNG